MGENYDPNSPNAMFARIMVRLDEQDTATQRHRQDMKELLFRHSDRIGGVERSVDRHRGYVAAIAVAVPLGIEAMFRAFRNN